jgi:hypothetical protein
MRRIINFVAALAVFGFSVRLQAQPLDIFEGASFPAAIVLTIANNGSTSLDEPPDYPAIFTFLDTLNNPGGIAPHLPDPTPNVSDYSGGPVEAGMMLGGPVEAGDYLFLLYGTPGNVNEEPTGEVAVIFFPTAQSSFSFPTTDEDVPLFFALLFDHVPASAPDGGLTLSLLGVAFAGLTFARRAIAKN